MCRRFRYRDIAAKHLLASVRMLVKLMRQGKRWRVCGFLGAVRFRNVIMSLAVSRPALPEHHRGGTQARVEVLSSYAGIAAAVREFNTVSVIPSGPVISALS